MNQQSKEQWDVFISHASEDKCDFVDPLARAIESRGYRVWYDKTSLKWGDSLFQAIGSGLRHSRYGIVILSKAFFRKRWPREELDGLFVKEENGKSIILPIWYGVTAQEIKSYSPLLLGKMSLSSEIGIEAIVSELIDVIGEPYSSEAHVPLAPESLKQEILSKHREGLTLWMTSKVFSYLKLRARCEEIFSVLRKVPACTNYVLSQVSQLRSEPTELRNNCYERVVAYAKSGTSADVDYLMFQLELSDRISTLKLVDFALGLVSQKDGVDRLQYYLFQGTQKQRNYAALYFKRQGNTKILGQAVEVGKIDPTQAYSR